MFATTNNTPVRFSLIVATMGRFQELDHLLASLSGQTFSNFQVIVVDQNRDDRLVPLLAEWSVTFAAGGQVHPTIVHLRSKPGLSYARNLGLKISSGEIIAFPDDDCLYPPGLLEALDRWFVENPKYDIVSVGSRDKCGVISGNRLRATECPIHKLNIFRASVSYSFFVRVVSRNGIPQFDEALGLGSGTPFESGEDTDFLLTCLKRGHLGWFCSHLHVIHPVKGHMNPSRGYQYGCGWGRVLSKHSLPLLFFAFILFDVLRSVSALLRGNANQCATMWAHAKGLARGYQSRGLEAHQFSANQTIYSQRRSSTMKVLLITSDIIRNDGQGRVNYEIARAALEEGLEVTLLTRRYAPELADYPNARIELIRGTNVPTELLSGMVFAFKALAWVRPRLREFDIIHVNGFVSWIPSDVNTVHFVHGAWWANPWFPFRKWWRSPYAAYQFLFTRLYSLLERYAFAHSRRIVAVSNTVAVELHERGVPQSQCRVVFNGVDPEEFHPGPGARDAFGLPAGTFLALFSGDIKTPRKNLETVIRAVARTPGVHLAVAGRLEGSPYPKLAEKMNVSDRIHFLGFVENMAALMRSADLFVFPSRYEACSLVLLEALATGLPVITARRAGGAELVGTAGRLLEDPNDAETLSQWISELAGDTEIRAQMAAQGRRIAMRHTWDVMAAQYLDLYASTYQEKNDIVANTREIKV